MDLERSGSSRHGPALTPAGVRFSVWAPGGRRLAVRTGGRDHPMSDAGGGFLACQVPGAGPGTRYQLVLEDGRALPDPASRRQPDGVHGPSQVVDPARHAWRTTHWTGLPLEALVLYELHLGTFTAEGTLDAAGDHLGELAALGVTCVELMPVQPFPGARNWGYDGVLPWAVHEPYGGPEALKRFVDRAHGLGLAVCLDVVYNHQGPEGNYLSAFGPYFTKRHRSPWGDGVNLDGEDAGPVRDFVLGAALRWLDEFRVDALRLDATHAIEDGSPRHLVGALCDAARALARATGRSLHVVCENDRNDRAVLDPPPAGWGADAVWADDLHHALHALVTGERDRFLQDFGPVERVVRALTGGFAYQGEPSPYRGGRRHGTDTGGLAPARFVTCLQNHDQVGNRPLGERITRLVPREALAPLAAVVLLGSGTPLLFMGEEYGEERPFLFFTSHGDPALAAAVTRGRTQEYIAAGGRHAPDPQAEDTFLRSRLARTREGWHGVLRDTYARLLAIRRRHLAAIAAGWPRVTADGRALRLSRPGLEVRVNLGPEPVGGLAGYGLAITER